MSNETRKVDNEPSEENSNNKLTTPNSIDSEADKLMEDLHPIVYGNRIASAISRRLPRLLRMGRFLSKERRMFRPSEIGESLRPVFSPTFIEILHALSWVYILADTSLKTYEVRKEGPKAMFLYCIDTLAWHSIASIFLPGISIHATVQMSSKLLLKFPKVHPSLQRWTPVTLGFFSIPFIVHPIDEATDWIFNKTIRVYYKQYVSKLQALSS